jgi:hypothetical protein
MVLAKPFRKENTMTTKPNKATLQARCQSAVVGITKYLSSVSTLILDGTSFTVADLTKLLASAATSATVTADAKGQYQAAVKAEGITRSQILTALEALQRYVVSQYGKTNVAVLNAFGFSTTPAKKPSSQTNAVKVQKIRATRTARHTMGPRQKAQIHGVVPVGSPDGAAPVPAAGGGGSTPKPSGPSNGPS